MIKRLRDDEWVSVKDNKLFQKANFLLPFAHARSHSQLRKSCFIPTPLREEAVRVPNWSAPFTVNGAVCLQSVRFARSLQTAPLPFANVCNLHWRSLQTALARFDNTGCEFANGAGAICLRPASAVYKLLLPKIYTQFTDLALCTHRVRRLPTACR